MKFCAQCKTGFPDQAESCPTHGGMLSEIVDLKPGMMIRGTYRIIRKLGEGGFGAVYLAEHTLMHEQRALKFLSRQWGRDDEFTARFRREVRTLRQVRHKNVVDCGDLERAEDDSLFFSMELVEGPDLRDFLRDAPRPFDVRLALALTRGIAEGLGAAHGKGMVHRDIKPDNILVARDGDGFIPKIVDFGIVATKEGTIAYTQTGSSLLTMAYAAPEQWKGTPAAELDGRTDLYALGGVLSEMLTGRTVFEPGSYERWMMQHLNAAPRAPSSLRPELAHWKGLDNLVLRLLAKNRDDRPKDVGEVLGLIDAVRYGAPVTHERTVVETPRMRERTVGVVPETRLKPGAKGFSRRAWFGVLALVLVGVVVGAWFWWAGSEDHTAKLQAVAAKTGARVNPKDGLNYVFIPAGSFEMGCSAGDSDCFPDEKPAHDVKISSGYWLGQTDVTQAAWKRVMNTEPSHFRGDQLPVESVSWNEAAQYCETIGGRLPTEAEWEYAARAGSTSARYGELDAIAWYNKNSGGTTHAVAAKQPNQFGLFDMLGNVWQWTADWYGEKYYIPQASTDPQGPSSGQDRVVRGGSWLYDSLYARASLRYTYVPTYRDYNLGFRCVGEFR